MELKRIPSWKNISTSQSLRGQNTEPSGWDLESFKFTFDIERTRVTFPGTCFLPHHLRTQRPQQRGCVSQRGCSLPSWLPPPTPPRTVRWEMSFTILVSRLGRVPLISPWGPAGTTVHIRVENQVSIFCLPQTQLYSWNCSWMKWQKLPVLFLILSWAHQRWVIKPFFFQRGLEDEVLRWQDTPGKGLLSDNSW